MGWQPWAWKTQTWLHQIRELVVCHEPGGCGDTGKHWKWAVCSPCGRSVYISCALQGIWDNRNNRKARGQPRKEKNIEANKWWNSGILQEGIHHRALISGCSWKGYHNRAGFRVYCEEERKIQGRICLPLPTFVFFLTAGKPNYKRERAASKTIANHPWTSGKLVMPLWLNWAEKGWYLEQTAGSHEQIPL